MPPHFHGSFITVLAGTAALARAPVLPEATASDVASWFAPSAKAQPKLVHLWATWCTPCVAELPSLLAALRSRKNRVEVVFLSLDSDSNATKAAVLLDRYGGVPGVSARVTSAAALAAIRAFDPAWGGSLPTTFLISREGHLAVAQRGITELEPLLSALDREAPIRNRKTAREEQP